MKETLKTTTNTSVYSKLIRPFFYCAYCAPNDGCNRRRKKQIKNWKKHRKTQYKSLSKELRNLF